MSRIPFYGSPLRYADGSFFSGKELPADYILQQDAGDSQWTGRGLNNSFFATNPDPAVVLNAIFQVALPGQKIISKGTISTATTVTYSAYYVYHHYGLYSYIGTGDAIIVDCGAQGANDSGGEIYIQHFATTATTYAIGTNAFHINNYVRSVIRVGRFGYGASPYGEFACDLLIDCSGNSFAHVIADNWFYVGGAGGKNCVHFLAGGSNGGFGEGNHFVGVWAGVAGATGVLMDAGIDTSFTQFFGTIHNSNGASWTNNGTSQGIVLFLTFLNDTAGHPNTYNGLETILCPNTTNNTYIPGLFVMGKGGIGSGTSQQRGLIKLYDATLAAYQYAYIDNGAWVISGVFPG
jgi:hypothetical protein